MALAELVNKRALDDIIAGLDDDLEVAFEEDERTPAKIVQLYPHKKESYTPNRIDELIIDNGDAEEAIQMIEKLSKSKSFFDDLDLRGGCREFNLAGNADDDQQVVSLADVSTQSHATPWAAPFMHGLVKSIDVAKGVTARLFDGAKVLMIAGEARRVGLAREEFIEAMRLAGLDVEWGEYKKKKDPSMTIEGKLKEYGIKVISNGDNENISLAFEALAQIPEEHKPAALRVIVDNVLADYQGIDKVVAAVQHQFETGKEFDKVQKILDRYSIQEDGLRHLLANSISAKKLDPDGAILKMLKEKDDLLSTAKRCHHVLGAVINNALAMDKSLGVYIREMDIPGVQVQERGKVVSFTPKMNN